MPASPRHRRAVTATKHESGLSSCRVVSYGSATEVRALPARLLSHYQRGRSDPLAVVPLLRAAVTLVPSGDERGRSNAQSFTGAFDRRFKFLQSRESPARLVSSLYAVTGQQWCGCVRRAAHSRLACKLPPPEWIAI